MRVLFSHAYLYMLVLVYSVKYISYGSPQSSEVIELCTSKQVSQSGSYKEITRDLDGLSSKHFSHLLESPDRLEVW